MRTSSSGFVVSLLLALAAATTAYAERSESFSAYVDSVDLKAKSITLRHTDHNKPPKWVELVAKWDESTKWEQEQADYKRQATTADVAAHFANDSKVYVNVNDNSTIGQEWSLKLLVILPSDSEVK